MTAFGRYPDGTRGLVEGSLKTSICALKVLNIFSENSEFLGEIFERADDTHGRVSYRVNSILTARCHSLD